jgi:hypothetical protein
MYQENWDGFEAMVWTICWLDILILAQKVGLSELNFRHLTPHPNGPAARHRAHGFPFKPSKIMHWMYQVNWDGFEAMVWTICWLDISILGQKVGLS